MNSFFQKGSPKTFYVLASLLVVSTCIVVFEFVTSFFSLNSKIDQNVETYGGVENIMTPFNLFGFILSFLPVAAGILLSAAVAKAIQYKDISGIQLAPIVVPIIVWLLSAWGINTFTRTNYTASLSVNAFQVVLIVLSFIVTVFLAYGDIKSIKKGVV